MWGAWRGQLAAGGKCYTGPELCRTDSIRRTRQVESATACSEAPSHNAPTCEGARQGVLVVNRVRGASRVGWERSSTELECSTTQ